MTAPQGTATFPGIPPEAVVSAEYTLQHGITPGICTMQIAPLGKRLRTLPGVLEFRFGNLKVQFPGARIQSAQWLANSSERRVQLTIVDRRWNWQHGAISGHYNQRRDNGSLLVDELVQNTERTPQELATLCLKAMNEQGYSVAALPNAQRPEVNWNLDNPAAALQDLCDMLGCRIVLGLDNRVRIARGGVGAKMPVGGEMDIADVIDPPFRPDVIAIVGGPTRYQADFELEAVGLDNDYKIRLINDLSYKPTAGWGVGNVFGGFHGLQFKPGGAASARAQAIESVFRWYRIKRIAGQNAIAGLFNGFPLLGDVAGYGPVVALEQILPIEDEQVELTTESKGLGVNSRFKQHNMPAVVWGVWYDGNDLVRNGFGALVTDIPADPNSFTTVRDNFTIDRERGIVKFSSPLGKLFDTPADGKQFLPADLRLRCAFNIQRADYSLERYVARRSIAVGRPLGTGTRYVERPDIVNTFRPKTAGKLDVVTNKEDCDKQAKFYLDAAVQEYQTVEPETATYAGLFRPPIDGAIQSITWRVGPSGATTSVSRNDERTNGRLPLYKSRRQREKAKKNEVLLNRFGHAVADLARQFTKGKP